MKVYLDPRHDIRYATFYIYGLYKMLGKKSPNNRLLFLRPQLLENVTGRNFLSSWL